MGEKSLAVSNLSARRCAGAAETIRESAPEPTQPVVPPGLRKVLYLVTEDWYFWSHRLPIARAMRDAGVEVVVACRVRAHGERIRAEGFTLRPLPWRRRGDGILGGLRALLAILRLYLAERPDLVHHIALKAILFGSVAAAFARVPRQVNLVAGLGFTFVSSTLVDRVRRSAIMLCLRAFAGRRNARIVVQNEEDGAELVRWGVFRRDQLSLVAGSGVDLQRFRPIPEPDGGGITGAMVCRMLRYKGVTVAVEAVRMLRRRGIPFRLLLVGPIDPDNSTSHRSEELEAWHREGLVEWLGAVEDVPGVWARAHFCVFPSMYREGVPKALLEAASCGRPIIASDMPGCRDVVKDGVTGLLVPERQAAPVAEAIIRLASDPLLRRKLGEAARHHVATHFAEELVVAQTLEVYRSVFTT
jgi:glycosyltransferase involved in cell wall biosynthesis